MIKKIFLIILFSIVVLFTCSCSIFDDIGEAVADKIVNEFDSSKNSPEPKGYGGVNEQLLYETILIEEVLEEKIITEKILRERIINEILNDQFLISENIIIESVHVGIYSSAEHLNDDFCCESYHSIDLDYALIKQRIAAGVSLVAAEVIIDTGSAIINIITLNWGGLLVDAGQIILTVGGTTLSAFIASQVAKAKSLKAGNSYEIAMYDALFEGAKSYYYTAVSIDAVNTIISLAQLTDLAIKSVKSLVNFIQSKQFVDIVDELGNVAGKAYKDSTFKIVIDGVEKKAKAAAATDLSGKSIDLYDIKTSKYLTSIVQNGDKLTKVTKTVPGELLLKGGDNIGKAKYLFNNGEAFKVTYTTDGTAIKTYVGNIDPGGFIKNDFGQIIKKIDFDTGKEINGFSKLLQSSKSSKITANVFGELVEITNTSTQATKPLTKKVVNGITNYLDSNNDVVLKEYKGIDNIIYLMRASDDINTAKVAGALSDGGYDFNWKTNLDYIRSNATSTIRKKMVEYIQTSNINLVRQNFPELTLEMIDYIKQYGRIPTNIQIHHVKNVANFPDLAGDFSNLVALTKESHLAAHAGNFHNATFAKPSSYVNLKYLFDL